MQVSCPHCHKVLEYSGDPPVFCAYCGQPLADDPGLMATGVYTPQPGAREPVLAGVGGETATLQGLYGRGDPGAGPDPEQVAGYRIVRLLGRGGMGAVYEAEDAALGRRVALKLIAADHVASPESVERFRQEGRLASTIAHPRCVFVLGADEYQGRPYIVMELMPGETLQALVERRGPLPPGEAVAKVLDVIDGLEEAHLLGVIHRDVKPSNCFLDADGRVKVGDFGLSKSLDSDAGLTRTGSFIGTPLYASPEQIKRDAVDARTDVYSVAATLFFLLTGRPPFEAADAAAALAKIVSEDPTPLRSLRPEVAPALEAAVRRGLERDRDRRYPDLDRFRAALLPFVSTGLGITDQVLRVTAYLTDAALLVVVHTAVVAAYVLPRGPGAAATLTDAGRLAALVGGLAAKRLLFLAYFTGCEGLWGLSVGKRLTGLRVRRVAEAGPPGPRAALVRTAVFLALTTLPFDVISLATVLVLPGAVAGMGRSSPGAWMVSAALTTALPALQAGVLEPLAVAAAALGYAAATCTMRASNGFRGVHEFASGTRVVRLWRPRRRRVPRGRRPSARPAVERARASAPGAGVLRAVGPYEVRGSVRWDAGCRVLEAEDTGLRRPVWVVLRPRGSAAPPPARRDLGRPGRPRWLNGGEQGEYRWDAYAPQLGCPLADLAGPDGLPWADARPVLHDLADELARACVDGTLPEALSVDQVWVQPDGTVQLVDALEADPRGTSGTGSGYGPGGGQGSGPAEPAPRSDQGRALDLLRRTAVVALEGGRRFRRKPGPGSIRAAVPAHAGRMLDRLAGRPRRGDAAYATVAALVADLEADRDKPTEVDIPRRAAHLAPSAATLLPVLAALFYLARPGSARPINPWLLLWLVPLVGVLWSAVTRGGLWLGVTGLALVRADSRPAERWRCAARTLLAWLPVSGLLALSLRAGSPALAWTCWGLAVAVVASYPVLALVLPSRSVHDRLVGTWLVPR